MKKFIKWLQEHVKPHVSYKPHKDHPEFYEDINLEDGIVDNIETVKENTEVGFKITFKF
jgi:hypothetical protein